MTISALQKARASYEPKVPAVLKGNVKAVEGKYTQSVADQEKIKQLFPHTYGIPVVTFEKSLETPRGQAMNVGVILSGGQAPGGHNVIAGLFDGIKAIHDDSRLFGFILGPEGLIKHKYMELTKTIIDDYRNTGGFDMIGSGRTKLETTAQFEKGLEVLRKENIKALVIIGGDDSNTNACVLAEYFKSVDAGVQVIGCPKTIDGDLKNEQIETSFGFDTACKVYSELIGNIQRDCNSARKYWHFIKLMGRSASHIALECALQTHPNICIISEEVEAKEKTLDIIVNEIAEIVAARAEQGMNFGTLLIPEGLVEFIPDMKRLMAELDGYFRVDEHKEDFKAVNRSKQIGYITNKLTKDNAYLYSTLPENVARQLLLERDDHGNFPVSAIETEKLLAEMVASRLEEWVMSGRRLQRWISKDEKGDKKYKGKFTPQVHFFGYEGRCAAPSNYDADYCYSLGYTASCLIRAGKTGYIASVRNTTAPAEQWIAGGIPITMMMNMELRDHVWKPVIQKALVKLDGAPFKTLAENRDVWAVTTDYVYPGPIQYFGTPEVCDQPTITLRLEQGINAGRDACDP